MTSNERILKIYWKRLAKRKRGKKETVFRCPRIAYRAAILTEDPKLEELFIDTHRSIKRYDDDFRQAFDFARREIYEIAHEAHDEKYPGNEIRWAPQQPSDYENMEKSIEADTAQKKGELEEILNRKKERHKRVIMPMRRNLIKWRRQDKEIKEREGELQMFSDDGPRIPPPLLSEEELMEFKEKYGLTTQWSED
jgi:hypothetical protein